MVYYIIFRLSFMVVISSSIIGYIKSQELCWPYVMFSWHIYQWTRIKKKIVCYCVLLKVVMMVVPGKIIMARRYGKRIMYGFENSTILCLVNENRPNLERKKKNVSCFVTFSIRWIVPKATLKVVLMGGVG